MASPKVPGAHKKSPDRVSAIRAVELEGLRPQSMRCIEAQACSTWRGAMKYSQVRAMKYVAGIIVNNTV